MRAQRPRCARRAALSAWADRLDRIIRGDSPPPATNWQSIERKRTPQHDWKVTRPAASPANATLSIGTNIEHLETGLGGIVIAVHGEIARVAWDTGRNSEAKIDNLRKLSA